jgi:hypothetical protein
LLLAQPEGLDSALARDIDALRRRHSVGEDAGAPL